MGLSLRQSIHLLILLARHHRGRLRAAEVAAFLPRLGESDICLDIGAHCGSWTWPLSDGVRLGQVHAFEALPYYAGLLERMAAVLGRRNVTVHNCALADRVGELRMVWQDAGGRRLTGYTHVAGREENTAGTIAVPARRLSDQLPRAEWSRVKFIKCDVEGAELGVFRGGEELLRTARPMMFAEVNDAYCQRYGHRAAEVISYLETLGYSPHRFDGQGGLVSCLNQPELPAGDFVFLPQ